MDPQSGETQIITKTSANPTNGNSHSYWHNLSGRFWIACLALNWAGVATILVLLGTVKLDSSGTQAIYTCFATGALGIVMTFMGQHLQNKLGNSSSSSTSVTTTSTAKQ